MKTLRPLDIPLRGINLIEASAGTGKTYTIETLLIRLLIEKPFLSNKILVVTFTNAATEELRHRIRQRISDTFFAFQQGKIPKTLSDDKILPELLKRYPDHAKVTRVLRYALQSFDEAAIFTIHGFCLRILHDYAFESGVLFDTTLLKDQRTLLQEIVEDFWRQHFYEASPLFINYVLENKYQHPHRFLPVIAYGRHLNQPFLEKIPPLETLKIKTRLEQDFWQIFQQTKIHWQSEGAQIEQLLLQDPNLNANKYRKTSIPKWCQELTLYFNAATPSLASAIVNIFEKFTTTHLTDSVKKGKYPPKHPFFTQCDTLFNKQRDLTEQFSAQLLTLKIKLFDSATQALAHKKRQHHFQSFDDLLINVNHALQGETGLALARQMCKKYPVALIDEFQDTDPVQYQIFKQIYKEIEKPTLFFIGDPKQAIYSFRGADIFTYMSARHDAPQQYTLETNWRADGALVEAINALFKQVPRPFIFEDIQFQSVKASPAHTESRLQIADAPNIPLQIWFISRAQANYEPTKTIPKKWAEPAIASAIGYEIAHLLQPGRVYIQGKPLEAGDIAILVRTNKQAQFIQKTLTQLRIPSVLYSGESLFISHEAMEIERILLAVANPTKTSLLKIALVTDMLGLSGNALFQLLENEDAWQTVVNRFHEYHTRWQNSGFMQMFRPLLTDYGVSARLLTFPDGERRLTNVLHVAELLQQTSVQQKLTMFPLCQWLTQQRQNQGEIAEEEQLRLESDEKRVKIVTIHKSKGLEYPIVFCPFVWDGKLYDSATEQFTFHDQENQEVLTLDLGSPAQEKHRESALREEQAENVRLFYVAVTRARHRCYLVWGGLTDAKTSAPARLWYPTLDDVEKVDDGVLKSALFNLIAESKNTIALSPLPMQFIVYKKPKEVIPTLVSRTFHGHIHKTWKIASFTSITKKLPVDLADYDQRVSSHVELVQTPEEQTILHFPTGAKAGNFFHKLFEFLDFTEKTPNEELIVQQLRYFSYEPTKWKTIIEQFVTDVVTTPLEPQYPDFTLSSIRREQRLNELEFYYPLNLAIASALRTEITTPRLTFVPSQGFMKGFIDLIFQAGEKFYLVDYKSNFLGTQMQAYHHSRLEAIMLREGYSLQYLVYTIALHRYLRMRLVNYQYERHFGGVYYLFLRGMKPHWGAQYGIYRTRPSVAFIESVN